MSATFLFCGGEDIDFPNGVAVGSGTGSSIRSGYARVALFIAASGGTGLAKGTTFPGGAVTSCWFTCRFYLNGGTGTSGKFIGLIKSGTNSGLFIATAAASASRIAIAKYDGTTHTQLAAETGNSLPTNLMRRIDVQVLNYGASATVNVYVDFALVVTYSGDVTVTGVTSVDQLCISGAGGGFQPSLSEFMVSDSDTRPLVGLQTVALTGAGTTANWTGSTFSNINGTTISDVNPASSNTNDQVQDYNVTDLTGGTFDILAVKISARMAKSATPAVAQVKLGYNNGSGSSGAGTGATKAVTTAYATYEQYDTINPITGVAWAQADMNALQLELTAKT